MKQHISRIIAALTVAVFSTAAVAAKPPPPPPQPVPNPTGTPCTTSNYNITAFAPSPNTPVATAVPISATSCIGLYSTPNNLGPFAAEQPNLGYLGNGLLNGEKDANNNVIVNPTQFLSSGQSLQDLNPHTNGAIDPGWVQLGSMSSNSGNLTTANVTPEGGSAFDLGQVLSFSQAVTNTSNGTIAGTWSLTINPNIVSILNANGLFQRSHFDHLAFEVKAASVWAVYDFDFDLLNSQYGNPFNLTIPYNISGTFNLDDFKNSNGQDQNISLMSVWARDPLGAETPIAEPGALALFGVGLLSLAGWSRRRQAR